jgi:hypothetical protein
MNQQNKNPSDAPSFVVGIILFFIIILGGLSPVIILQMYRPEKFPLRTNGWNTISRSADNSVWGASDGITAEHVNMKQTPVGFSVILQQTESATREGFYNEGLITKRAFNLSADVNTPTDCYNGLVFRGNELGEYYLFLVGFCANTYTVEILQRESDRDLPREAIIPNTKISDKIGQPRNLTVIGSGEYYYFYINGSYVDYVRDSRLNGNRVGVEVLKCNGTNDEIVFDFNNFVLTSPRWPFDPLLFVW